VLSGRGLCDELITRPEESYRLCCIVVCDLETSRMGAPYIYIYDISRLRVNLSIIWRWVVSLQPLSFYTQHPFNLGLDKPESRSGCSGEKKHFLPQPGIEPSTGTHSTVLSRASHWSPSRTSRISCTLSYNISLSSIAILSFHLELGSLTSPLSFRFTTVPF